MPLTSAQILSLARQDARCPGFTSQSGQILNMVLSDLCQTYDFDLAKTTYQFSFNPAQINSIGQAYQNLPANYLRGIKNSSFYYISGVPYPMIPVDQEEGDMFVEQAGLSNFPVFYWTDMTLSGITNSPTGAGGSAVPVMLFWEVPSGNYPVTVRYFSQMADIATPETSTTVPWFPNQTYLRTRVAGELMKLTDDERADAFLSSDEDHHPQGAGVMLRHYLQMKDDKGTRVRQVTLDRRRFGTSFDRLKNTKTVGWMVQFTIILGGLLSFLFSADEAHAQTGSAKTPTAIATEVNTLWPDNTTGQITPFNARQTLLDIVASYLSGVSFPIFIASTATQSSLTSTTSDGNNVLITEDSGGRPAIEFVYGGNSGVIDLAANGQLELITQQSNPIVLAPGGGVQFTMFGDGGTSVGTRNDVGPGHVMVATAVNAGGSGLLIANLPACVATREGFFTYVTNGATSPTYLSNVSATGSTVAPVFCNGTNWIYH